MKKDVFLFSALAFSLRLLTALGNELQTTTIQRNETKKTALRRRERRQLEWLTITSNGYKKVSGNAFYNVYDDDEIPWKNLNKKGDPEDYLRDADLCVGTDGNFSRENCPKPPDCSELNHRTFKKGKLCINRVPFWWDEDIFFVGALKCIPQWENCDKCVCGLLTEESLKGYCYFNSHDPDDDRTDVGCETNQLKRIGFKNNNYRVERASITSSSSSSLSSSLEDEDEDDNKPTITREVVQGSDISYVYLGCYEDREDRALPTQISGKHSVEECIAACDEKYFRYAGRQYDGECWCGNSGYDKHGPSNLCNQCDSTNVGVNVNCVYEKFTLPLSDPTDDYDDKNNISVEPTGPTSSTMSYSYFRDDAGILCVELKDGDTTNGSNLWFQKCENGKDAQLWIFDYEEGGKLHSKIDYNKCVQATKKYIFGSRLRIDDCDDNKHYQQWEWDGDGFGPRQASGVTAYSHRGERGAKKGNFLVLHDHAYSLDFVSED